MSKKKPEVLTARKLPAQDVGELILHRVYTGDAGQLATGIGELSLLRDFERMQAVRAFHDRLQAGMNGYGYLTPMELEKALEDHLEDMALDYDPRETEPTA